VKAFGRLEVFAVERLDRFFEVRFGLPEQQQAFGEAEGSAFVVAHLEVDAFERAFLEFVRFAFVDVLFDEFFGFAFVFHLQRDADRLEVVTVVFAHEEADLFAQPRFDFLFEVEPVAVAGGRALEFFDDHLADVFDPGDPAPPASSRWRRFRRRGESSPR